MSCSNNMNAVLTSCDDVKHSAPKLYVVVTSKFVKERMAEEAKELVMEAIKESAYKHIQHPEQIILIDSSDLKEVMEINWTAQYAICDIKNCHIVIRSLESAKKMEEPVRPDKEEIRERNREYRNRQRFHSRYNKRF